MIEGYSLYFHVPFCTKKCPYCHFFVLPHQENLVDVFSHALKKEWVLQSQLLKSREHVTIRSIYFGGGTPYLLGSEQIAEILKLVKADFPLDPACEITLEANPDNITLTGLTDFFNTGINRLSIGVQSLDENDLKGLGRTHSGSRAIESILLAKEAGFTNVSIDLMYDLPGQTLESWERTLSKACELPISHLSLYNLTFEPGTVFFKNHAHLAPSLPSEEVSCRMHNMALKTFEDSGLKRYEISAFARDGKISVHNSGYWTGRPFLGLGPSAFGYLDGRRMRNVCNLGKYAAMLHEGKLPIDFEEKIPYPNNVCEMLVVWIRLVEGVPISLFEEKFGKIPSETVKSLEKLELEGFVQKSEGRYALTDSGRLFYDSVALELTPPAS